MIKIPEELLSKILKKALSKGGDYADIYIAHDRPLSIQLEDDKIEKIVSGIDSGIGVRVVFGGKSAYAYSNDFSEASLFNIADAVSSAVRENRGGKTVFDLRVVRPSVDFKIKHYPHDVAIEKKIFLVENANKAAKGISPKIRQVSVIYRDSVQNICIASVPSGRGVVK